MAIVNQIASVLSVRLDDDDDDVDEKDITMFLSVSTYLFQSLHPNFAQLAVALEYTDCTSAEG